MRYQVAGLTLVCLSFCSQAQEARQNRPRSFQSGEKEVALGAQLAAQVRRQTTQLELVNVDRYVEKLGRDLAPHMPNSHEDWKFSLIRDREDSSTREPISLPGAWIFIPAQLVLASNNEGEFAGMLAHAMAHIAERHQIRQTPGDATNLAAIPLVFVGGPAVFGGGDRNGLAPAGYLRTQRQYELEADEVAAKAMAAAGFNPNDLLNYIARMQPEHSKLPEEISPLPSLAVRIGNLKHAIQTLSASNKRESSDSFQFIQDDIRRDETRREKAVAATPNQAPRIPSLIHPDGK